MTTKLSTLFVSLVLILVAAPAAGAATFTWDSEETLVTGSSTKDLFHLFGSTLNCTENTWNGSFLQGSTAMTISPSYKKCKAFLPATVTAPKDAYTFTADGTLHINNAVSVHVYSSEAHTTALCHVVIPAQTATGKASYVNNADGSITVSGTVGSLTATQNRTSIGCPAGTHATTVSYTIGAVVLESEFRNIHIK